MSMEIIIWALVGFVGGIISGLGIGGGSLTIPLLLLLGQWLTPWDQKAAQTANLLAFLPAACVALYSHIKQKRVIWAVSKQTIPLGLLGAIGGAILATITDAGLLRRGFGIFLLLLAVYEFIKGQKAAKAQ